MELTNFEMDTYLQELRKISEKVTGKLAYAVARNIRKISGEIVEYQNLKDNAIKKYGEAGEDGRWLIHVGSEGFRKFEDEMNQYIGIKHDVPIYMVTEDDLLSSSLNANEMLLIDFMVQENEPNNTNG